MKSVKDFFFRDEKHRGDRAQLEAESKQFKIPSEWLPQALKIIFFIGTAFLNYRLFLITVSGFWGHATGLVAIMAEGLAMYCTHYFSRSSGLYRIVLGVVGFVLIAFG